MENHLALSLTALRVFLSCVILPFIFAGCLNNETEPQTPQAYVTIHHASPDASALDVILNSDKITTQAFSYGDYSGYINFDAGVNFLQFNTYSTETKLADASVTIKENQTYSLFIVNRQASMETFFVRDSSGVASSGKSKVRLVHLSPDAPALTLSVSGQTAPLFPNRIFKTATPFQEMEANTYSFDIRTSNGTVLKTVPGIVLSSGRNYTLAIRGFDKPPAGNNNAITLQLLAN